VERKTSIVLLGNDEPLENSTILEKKGRKLENQKKREKEKELGAEHRSFWAVPRQKGRKKKKLRGKEEEGGSFGRKGGSFNRQERNS